MNTKFWNPKSIDHLAIIDESLLKRFLEISINGDLSNISNEINPTDIGKFNILNNEEHIWIKALKNFKSKDLMHLIKFFTLIEMQLPEWKCEEKSPVIKINKVLKERGEKIEKNLLIWMKKNSTNRYIPNGRIL